MKSVRVSTLVSVTILMVAIPACGDDASDTPAPPVQNPTAGSDEDQIRAVAERYKTAVAEADPELLCEQVLPPSLLGGGQIQSCIEINTFAMEQAGTDLGPGVELSIDSVEIDDDKAIAEVSDANVDSVEFLKEKGRWWMVVYSEPIPVE